MPDLSVLEWLWVLAGWVVLGILAYAPFTGSRESPVDLVSRTLTRDGDAFIKGWRGEAKGAGSPSADAGWDEWLSYGVGSLGRGGIKSLTLGSPRPAQRIFGSFLYLGLFLVFLMADAALGYNIMSALYAQAGIVVPPLPEFLGFLSWFITDVGFSRIIAFFVISVTSGVILVDLLGFTEFTTPVTGVLRRVFILLVCLNIAVVLILIVLWGLGIFATLNRELAVAMRQTLYSLSNFAAYAIIVPSFLTTLLLWSGVLGIFTLLLLIPSGMTLLLLAFLIVALFVCKAVTHPLKIFWDGMGNILKGP